MSTRSRWLDWKPGIPGTSILAEAAKAELTKTTETIFGVFVSPPLAVSQKIETEAGQRINDTSRECKSAAEPTEVGAEPTQEQIDQAGKVLAQAGMRLMELKGLVTVGLWSDLDWPEVRAAIAVFHPDGVPVAYLDGGGIPMRYKLRKVPGEPVPANVIAAMERHPVEPWKVRDRMLEEMGWSPEGIPWAKWKAASLNKLLEEQGVTGEPGRITAATVRHGERGGHK